MMGPLRRLFEELRRKRRLRIEEVQQRIADAMGIDEELEENDRRLEHLRKQRDLVARRLHGHH